MSQQRAISVEQLRRCWFLAGPTAVGKSELSLQLASQMNAEILSLDSMAIYCGMDIGTAKPDTATRQRIPHHLIDIATVDQEFTVADFLQHAAIAVREVLSRNRIPLFVGGTGLYLRSLLRGVFDGPEADWDLRHQLADQAKQHGNDWLHQQLKSVDAATADRLHPNDVRRIIRAIEVFRLTGTPLSIQQNQAPIADHHLPCFWLCPEREWLYVRINQRVDKMMQQGLVEETKWLQQHDPPAARTALQALGYRELLEHFAGHCSLEEAVDRIKTNTRQFAKRQHTWFRNLQECHEISVRPDSTTSNLLNNIQTVHSLNETNNL